MGNVQRFLASPLGAKPEKAGSNQLPYITHSSDYGNVSL